MKGTVGVAEGLRKIQDGAVARAILPEVLNLVEREGIIERVVSLSLFASEDLCRVLQSDLGYTLGAGNRRRMIGLLLDLLSECGWVREEAGVWRWVRGQAEAVFRKDGMEVTPGDSPEASEDDQLLFFRKCLASVPPYLRGGPPSLLFDEGSVVTWERFLGCPEFRTCRSLLLEVMGIENRPSFHLLDLCHGPGWSVQAAASRFPAIRITALDFTDAFTGKARARLECMHARHRKLDHPAADITWVGPDRWKGFGHPLPFADGAFDAVFFSCGDPYVPRHRRREVYREIRRVLAPQGKLGILTRCRPDAGARHVPSFWLRISALVHDFLESVCEGWEGFSDAEENIRLFSDAGFQSGGSLFGAMTFLESSLWVLKKGRGDG